MAYTEHYFTKFEESSFYHIYNRSVDKKTMFKNDGNYEYFLRKFDQYLSPLLDTYAYCLLGNHFHLLIRVHDVINEQKVKNITSITEKTTHEIISEQFRSFFLSYAKAFNKQHNRIGTLFQTPFKRALIDTDEYFTQLIYYIHANPQLHGLTNDFKEWKWSSYGRMLIDNPTKLKKEAVLNWFGNKERYKQYHTINSIINLHDKYKFEE